jgi:hypothetical protein
VWLESTSRLDKHQKNFTQSCKNKCENGAKVFSKEVECFRSTQGPEALPVSQYCFKSACVFLYFAFSLHYQTGTAMTQYIKYCSFILNNSSSKDEIFYKAATSACPKYFSFVHFEVWFLNSVTVLHGHILGLWCFSSCSPAFYLSAVCFLRKGTHTHTHTHT